MAIVPDWLKNVVQKGAIDYNPVNPFAYPNIYQDVTSGNLPTQPTSGTSAQDILAGARQGAEFMDPANPYQTMTAALGQASADSRQLSDLQWQRQMEGLGRALGHVDNSQNLWNSVYGARPAPAPRAPTGQGMQMGPAPAPALPPSQYTWPQGGPTQHILDRVTGAGEPKGALSIGPDGRPGLNPLGPTSNTFIAGAQQQVIAPPPPAQPPPSGLQAALRPGTAGGGSSILDQLNARVAASSAGVGQMGGAPVPQPAPAPAPTPTSGLQAALRVPATSSPQMELLRQRGLI